MIKNHKYKTKNISDVKVCEAVKLYQNNNENFVYDYLMKSTGAPFKVCFRAMERSFKMGYIDYGISLGCSWLTNKGKEILN